jgi:hypothetical protein
MLTEIDRQYIDSIRNESKHVQESKMVLNRLKTIKERITGERFTKCFCSAVVRKNYLKDFYNWYESNLR